MKNIRTIFALAALIGAFGLAPSSTRASSELQWQGPYIGLFAGGSRSATELSSAPNALFANSGFQSDAIAGRFISENGRIDLDANSFSGGVQVGFGVQYGRIVVGLDADITFHDLGSKSDRGPFTDAGFTTHRFIQSAENDFIVTVRPRIGYAFDAMLIYGTAGLAFGRFKFVDTTINNSSASLTYPGLSDGTAAGFVYGGGSEYKLSSHWSIKAELLRVDFLAQDFVAPQVGLPTLFSIGHTADVTVDMARAGLSYRF